MAFDELGTDERLDAPVKPEADMDVQMIGGCSSFVAAALITYVLSIWPFFALHSRMHELGALTSACALGLVPASAFGAFAGGRWGLPTACGFFGGAMTTAVFLYLMLQQASLGHTVRELPVPDYPATFMWWIPLGWLVFALMIAIIFSAIGEHRHGLWAESRR